MKRKSILLLVTGIVALGAWPALTAWAGGAGGDPPATCLVQIKDVYPSGIAIVGTIAVSADLDTGASDVILRLKRGDEVHFFRASYLSSFTTPTLQGDQGRLCNILNSTGLASTIIGAFNLEGTKLVITPFGIRNTEISPPDVSCDEDPNQLVCKIPGIQFLSDPNAFLNPGNPHHGIIISDVILYVK